MPTLQEETLAQTMQDMKHMPVEDAETYLDEQGANHETRNLEAHLVEFCNECVKESYEATKDRRAKDEMLWRAHETEQAEMDDKEDWQSQIVLNNPFTTVTQAASIVRSGVFERGKEFFTMTPFDQEDPMQVMKSKFWQEALAFWENRPEAKIRTKFVDASRIGFSVGQSMAMKFLFSRNMNGRPDLICELIEPWKTYPDPHKRKPRQPQSGLYNIHEEWVDLSELLVGARLGLFRNIDRIQGLASSGDEARAFRHDIESEREYERNKTSANYQSNKFRKQLLQREFYGDVLDQDGDLLMENVTWTQVNNVVIAGPYPIKYPTLRWPWIDFCPLPHPIRFHGYGLYEGSILVWKFLNAVLNLYIDNENFRVANMWEVVEEALRDPTDTEIFPGKRWVKKPGFPDPAITPVVKAQSNLSDVQFMFGLASKLWEDGTFVNPFVKGSEGTRKITAAEFTAKTQQSLGVFDTISQDTEDGLVQVLNAAREVLTTYWNPQQTPDFHEAFKHLQMYQYLASTPMMPDERMKIMGTTAQVKVSGISKAFEKQKTLENIVALAEFGKTPEYQPYMKHYDIAKTLAEQMDQRHLVMSDQEKEIMDRQVAVQNAVASALSAGGIQPEEGAPAEGGAPAPAKAGGGNARR